MRKLVLATVFSLLLPVLSWANVQLDWTAPASGGTVDTYEVWRSVNGATPINITTVNGSTFTYTDAITTGRVCYYLVAKNAGGQSATPNVCVTLTTPPGRPATFTATII